jgi:transcription termination factor Rho
MTKESNSPSRSRRGPSGRSHGNGQRGRSGNRGNSQPLRSRNHDGDKDTKAEPRPEWTGPVPPPLSLFDLQDKTVPELHEIAEKMELKDIGALRKHELIFEILQEHANRKGVMFSQGIIEILPDGFGFLRSQFSNYLPCPEDIYVSPSQIRRFGLRTGDLVEGEIREPKDKERFFALL